MRHYIKQLRKKPAHVRERIALGVTAVGTLVLVFFWVSIVRYEILPKQKLAESRSPFQVLGDIFQNSYKSTVANVISIGEETVQTGEGRLIVVPQEEIPSKDKETGEENSLEIAE